MGGRGRGRGASDTVGTSEMSVEIYPGACKDGFPVTKQATSLPLASVSSPGFWKLMYGFHLKILKESPRKPQNTSLHATEVLNPRLPTSRLSVMREIHKSI